MTTRRQTPRQRQQRSGCLRGCVLGFLLVAITATFAFGYWFSDLAALAIGGRTIGSAEILPEAAENLIETISAVDEAILPNPETLAAQLLGPDRVTMLLMGIDRRGGESLSYRTDTMILLSIDPEGKSADILSIPRDLYVQIPGYADNRINTAFFLGVNEGGAERGAQLAMETIQLNLGIPVDHFALIDFETVVYLIDYVGGVTVNVPYTIDDPTYPDNNFGFDPLYIEAGVQQFSGELALKYMRTRHGDSDFNRSERQQQTILALRNKIMAQGVNQLIADAPTILNDVEEQLYTDMTTGDIINLGRAAGSIDQFSIDTAVLDYNYVESYTTSGGASVVVLRTDEAQELIDTLFE